MRHADWTDRLLATASAWQNEPFEYGVNDCCLFAARCADAIAGSSWVDDLQSHYWDRDSALAYIEAEGGIEASVARRLGDPVPRLQARRGDVCLLETPEGRGLGVCVGATALIPSDTGLQAYPLGRVLKAWRID